MDFGTVLHKASKNENQKREVRYYSTKFEPPKKEQREKKSLSANIQKFLARQEANEKRKHDEERQRRDQLLELRSKDKKAVRRVNIMLKRTKSANQSVLDDAIDSDNTAVTLAGPSQPDEDDYGYVSQSAADYYNKMMDKYSKIPDEPKFNTPRKKVSTNLSSTKDRVKAALDREKEEALLPHKRKRKHKEPADLNNDPEEEHKTPEKRKDKPKSRPNIPPPMNFSELLKVAEKKQFEPIMIEVKEEKEERLLTKKQRREADKELEYLQQKEARKANANKLPPQSTLVNKPNIAKLNISPSNKNLPTTNPNNNRPGHNNKKPDQFSIPLLTKRPNILNQSLIHQTRISENTPNYGQVKNHLASSLNKGNPSKPLQQNIMKLTPVKNAAHSQSSSGKLSTNLKAANDAVRHKQVAMKDDKSKEMSFRDAKLKQMTSKDERTKQLVLNYTQRFPTKDVKMNQNPRRIYDDEDDDYDSEMDDFIDDGEDAQDVSRHIKEIFGYDKKKYSRNDDNCDDMETTFAQQMREEVISTKIAIKEDLDDMKLEEELKKRKAFIKKRR